ncbi:MAG: prepilin-type N-terminal cleavage/methylation domain-containing protein [Candidatus Saccharibacteria bacterium]
MISKSKQSAFTIVELLVVIVVIGILAAITIISYTGISRKATEASLQSDLSGASRQLEMFKVDNGSYPTAPLGAGNCTNDPKYCLKPSSGNTFDYAATGLTPQTYSLTATNTSSGISYIVTESTKPTLAVSAINPFVKVYGGSGSDYARSLIKTSDGGFATVGTTDSYGEGMTDAFIVKYSSNGTISWNKTWGGSSSEAGDSIVQTSDGGFAITGNTASFGVNGSPDVFVAKYSADGSLLWDTTWGDASSDYGYSIIQTSDGGLAVTGYLTNVDGREDAILLKYTSGGTYSWSKATNVCGIYDPDYGRAIIQTSDGGYLTVGKGSRANDGFNATSNAIIKYTTDGTVSWLKTWSYNGYNNIESVFQTSDGGYIATGSTSSYSNGLSVIKFNSTGDLLWNRVWSGGNTNSDGGYSIIQTSDGGFAISGSTEMYGAGNFDVLLAKYSSDGTLAWSKTWGGSGYDSGDSLVQTSDGGFVITGVTDSYGTGGQDMFLIKFNSSGSIVGCSSPICQSPSASTFSPAMTILTPWAPSFTSPSLQIGNPLAISTSQPITSTVIIAP